MVVVVVVVARRCGEARPEEPRETPGARVFPFPRVGRGHWGEDEVSAAEAFVVVPRARPEGPVGVPDVVRFGGADRVEDGEGDNDGGMVEFATEWKIGAPRGIGKTDGRVGDAGCRRHRGKKVL